MPCDVATKGELLQQTTERLLPKKNYLLFVRQPLFLSQRSKNQRFYVAPCFLDGYDVGPTEYGKGATGGKEEDVAPDKGLDVLYAAAAAVDRTVAADGLSDQMAVKARFAETAVNE